MGKRNYDHAHCLAALWTYGTTFRGLPHQAVTTQLWEASTHPKAWQHLFKTKAMPTLNQASAEYDALRPWTMYACSNSSRAPLWGDTPCRALAAACLPPLYGSRLPEV